MTEPLKFTDLGSYEEFATMEMDRLHEKVQQLNLDIVGLKIKNTQLEAELLEWKARAISLFHMVPGDVTVGELKNAKDAILKELGNK